MKTFGKILLLTLIINVLRYYPLSYVESLTIMEGMFGTMEAHPQYFGFTPDDLPWSYLYNFILWLCVVVIYHLAHRQLNGSHINRSLQVFAICGLFFISLTAVYMNHFNLEIRSFFRYSMMDALILFFFLGLANGLVYPKVFRG